MSDTKEKSTVNIVTMRAGAMVKTFKNMQYLAPVFKAEKIMQNAIMSVYDADHTDGMIQLLDTDGPDHLNRIVRVCDAYIKFLTVRGKADSEDCTVLMESIIYIQEYPTSDQQNLIRQMVNSAAEQCFGHARLH